MEPEKDARITPKVIQDEMKEAYMAYAMSVIIGRALPHIRDGLKPVHRRILYAMHDMGVRHNQPFKKSARIVGDVLGKYHPHGDSAIYDTMVRMAQDFSLRYTLIDGQGNWGSIDGDKAAAMRYTESRLTKISQELLGDIDKDTVDWNDNFDGSLQEPSILPATLPNLIVNGSSGIAVGMATNMPPHNLTETTEAINAYLDNPDLSLQELATIIPGPDFPTGGTICGTAGILQAYNTGRGKVILRGVIEQERKNDKTSLIITEIPYQVVKADLIEQIADNVREKKIEGIADIRDESDRQGMRVVITLKRDANPEVVENTLYKYTRLQTTFGINNLAIVDGQPQLLTLPELIEHFLAHRRDVITRRTQYLLTKAEERAHIVEGLLKALNNIDAVVDLIKQSPDAAVAKQGLITTYSLSERQADAILEMRLSRLTGLEQQSLREEIKELYRNIKDYNDILAQPERVNNLIREELSQLQERYGDARRTTITEAEMDIDLEDLIDPEEMIVTISHQGYTKRLPVDTYQAQRRGGIGIVGATTKEGDFVEHLFVANTHSYLLFFSNKGKVYWKKVYRIPETGRTAKGTPLINLLELEKDEHISAVIPVAEFSDDRYLVFATKQGYIKKTSLAAYSRPRNGGIWAIKLEDDDNVVRVTLTDGDANLLLATKRGQALRFHERDARSMGRYSRGVIGMRLRGDDEVISLVHAEDGTQVFTITENGYGKRTPVEEYRVQGRGGYGVRNIITNARNGVVEAVRVIQEHDDLLLISIKGIIMRTSARDISSMGRSTQGVRCMRLRSGDKVSSIAKVLGDDGDDIEDTSKE